MAKVRIQARSADTQDTPMHHDHPPYPNENNKQQRKHAGALDVLAGVWKREGYFGWYQVCVSRSAPFRIESNLTFCIQGMQAQITKAVLSQALLFMSKEQFEHWALGIMILFARFSARWHIS